MEKPEQESMTIDDLIAQVGRQQDKPMICTGWVLVCEGYDGVEYSMETYTDTNNPEWRHSGLLQYASSNFLEVMEEEEQDEDESAD